MGQVNRTLNLAQGFNKVARISHCLSLPGRIAGHGDRTTGHLRDLSHVQQGDDPQARDEAFFAEAITAPC
jgi:hypothetical protein